MAEKGGAAHKPTIVIVKKKQKAHEAHHGGAWKVAYADFVTAMMAFFMVMWLVNQNEEVKTAVGGYFRDPFGAESTAGVKAEGSAGVLSHGVGAMDGQDGLLDSPLLTGHDAEPRDPEEERRELSEIADEIRRALTQIEAFEEIAEQVEVTQTEEGVRIELMEDEKGTFFERGAKRLTGIGERVVRAIGATLGKKDHPVVIEGHTDSLAYAGGEYSNWDLSTDRANAARKLLTASGLPAQQVKGVRGYAAERPRFRDRPEDPRNRRVSILLPNRAPRPANAAAPAPPPPAAPAPPPAG
jgi:chemotaxis protein MotB